MFLELDTSHSDPEIPWFTPCSLNTLLFFWLYDFLLISPQLLGCPSSLHTSIPPSLWCILRLACSDRYHLFSLNFWSTSCFINFLVNHSPSLWYFIYFLYDYLIFHAILLSFSLNYKVSKCQQPCSIQISIPCSAWHTEE